MMCALVQVDHPTDEVRASHSIKLHVVLVLTVLVLASPHAKKQALCITMCCNDNSTHVHVRVRSTSGCKGQRATAHHGEVIDLLKRLCEPTSRCVLHVIPVANGRNRKHCSQEQGTTTTT